MPAKLKVIIVGCGLGGLACAIACRREDLDVVVLEKAAELSEIGAGIQLPPNAGRIMSDWGLLDKLIAAGGSVSEGTYTLRWQDGSVITNRPGVDWTIEKFGQKWHIMHRADYQRVLIEEAKRLGVTIRLGCEVVSVESGSDSAVVQLANRETVNGDVIVGADGLHSIVRTAVLGYVKEPVESGDVAYRITIPRPLIQDDPDDFVRDIVSDHQERIWWGPNQHAILYAVRNDSLANLVLCCPDDLPSEVSRQPGDLAEMHKLFESWDPRLRHLLTKVNRALKWKIWTMPELDVWVKGRVALLGDACHPSLPYAASGAAMAVEDGATLGRLLGLFAHRPIPRSDLPSLLELYQEVRKKRAATTVKTADGHRKLYHMPDGQEQKQRDRLFATHDWWDEGADFPFKYGSMSYGHELYGFDTLGAADKAFDRWSNRQENGVRT